MRPCSGSYGAVAMATSDSHALLSVISRNIDGVSIDNKNSIEQLCLLHRHSTETRRKPKSRRLKTSGMASKHQVMFRLVLEI